MTILRTGSTQKYADNFDRAFGNKSTKKTSASSAKKTGKKKKTTKKKKANKK